MVDEVAGDHRALALGLHDDRAVARGVAGRRDEPDAVADRGRSLGDGLDGLRQAGVDDRLHGILEHAPLNPEEVLGVLRQAVDHLVVDLAEQVEFVLVHQILRVRKRGHPLPVHLVRIPTHVVEMQVGAQHVVDAVRVVAGGLHVVQIRRRQPAHDVERVAVAAVADAGIDHDGRPGRVHDQGMDAQREHVARSHERGNPADLPDDLRSRRGDDVREFVVNDLLDFGDFRVADLPVHGVLLFPRSSSRTLQAIAAALLPTSRGGAGGLTAARAAPGRTRPSPRPRFRSA